ncbi:hypothetical protein WA026_014503 [Henosepilachna vigintioctopunctata]|uniref:Uncharacterized protein n=1 Tax=Henosepilachna vigintioctopunctata TaxID=420089 RepID=A0AAW1UER5_9CUCU
MFYTFTNKIEKKCSLIITFSLYFQKSVRNKESENGSMKKDILTLIRQGGSPNYLHCFGEVGSQ